MIGAAQTSVRDANNAKWPFGDRFDRRSHAADAKDRAGHIMGAIAGGRDRSRNWSGGLSRSHWDRS